MFRAEHLTLPLIPRFDSSDSRLFIPGGRIHMNREPVDGRKQFQTVRRLESFN